MVKQKWDSYRHKIPIRTCWGLRGPSTWYWPSAGWKGTANSSLTFTPFWRIEGETMKKCANSTFLFAPLAFVVLTFNTQLIFLFSNLSTPSSFSGLLMCLGLFLYHHIRSGNKVFSCGLSWHRLGCFIPLTNIFWDPTARQTGSLPCGGAQSPWGQAG